MVHLQFWVGVVVTLSLSEGPSLQLKATLNQLLCDTVTVDDRQYEGGLVWLGVKRILCKVGSCIIALSLGMMSWGLHCEERWHSHDER